MRDDTVPTGEQERASERQSLPRLLGLGAAACAACCIGPILAALGAITAGGILSTRFIGAVGLIIAAGGAIAFVAVRRGRADACKPSSAGCLESCSADVRSGRGHRARS